MNCELNHHRYTIETRIGSKWIFKRKPQTTNRREQKNRRTDEQTNSNSNLHLQNFDVSVENVKEWKHERETNRQTKNDKHVVWTFVKVTEMIISGFNEMPGKWNGFSRRRCAHINVIFGKWFFFLIFFLSRCSAVTRRHMRCDSIYELIACGCACGACLRACLTHCDIATH